ncbi:craniofacial development protein 2-like [Sitophilus oryzae]|uniref:Craniofacial development protein 2-like n=1 Tax=Sitophilus oryzae TaxID=7048 RepID=A0A6J2XZS9_SITOR|nr:craniofacial development protein 2-like [Sitophilus oryzae]
MSSTRMRDVTDHGIRKPRSGRGGISRLDHGASQVVIQRNPRDRRTNKNATILKTDKSNKKNRSNTTLTRIATWNIKTLYKTGKLTTVAIEMRRMGIEVLGLSEVRWPNAGECNSDNVVLYYSGCQNGEHQHGVGIMIKKELKQYVANFVPYNERMMLIQLRTKPINTNLIQVYAPTADSDEETIEKFYSDLNELTKKLKKHEINVIMGDFNAKVGKGRIENTVGGFGLGDRNERGERLIEFCQEKDLVIANTFYELPPRRLYTWTSPRSSKEKIIRNQIDFICVNRRFRNSIESAKTYPGADADTDHELLVANVKVRLRKLQRIIKPKIINTEKLKQQQYQKEFNDSIASEFLEASATNIDMAWDQIKSTMLTAADQVVGRREHNTKNPWMTQEIINLIEEKRKYKNTDPQKYKQSKRQIEHRIRKAKETWMEENCREMEQLNNKHDYFNLHKKLKELTGNKKKEYR